MARKKAEGGGGAPEWMATYSDLVTLLLCFFILLFSMSSVSVEKFEMLVKSFTNMNGQTPQVVLTPEGDGTEMGENQGSGVVVPDPNNPNPPTSNELPQNMDQLYEYLKTYVEENDMATSVEVKQQNGMVFIRFNDNIFFNPNSYIMKDGAETVLNDLGTAFSGMIDKISLVRVNGHTADVQNSSGPQLSDRVLSSDRANAVVEYFENEKKIPGVKLLAVGFGKYSPVAPNDTEANRAKNRRVEVLILGNNIDTTDPQALLTALGGNMDSQIFNDDQTPPE